MKHVMEPIEVSTSQEPWRLRWRGQVLTVQERLESWSWRGRWWLDPQLAGERRRYYRVLCQARSQRVLEIFCRRQDGKRHWILSRIVD